MEESIQYHIVRCYQSEKSLEEILRAIIRFHSEPEREFLRGDGKEGEEHGNIPCRTVF